MRALLPICQPGSTPAHLCQPGSTPVHLSAREHSCPPVSAWEHSCPSVTLGALLSTCQPFSHVHKALCDTPEDRHVLTSHLNHFKHQLSAQGLAPAVPPSHTPLEAQHQAPELRRGSTHVGISENTRKQPTRNTSVPTTAAGRSQPV